MLVRLPRMRAPGLRSESGQNRWIVLVPCCLPLRVYTYIPFLLTTQCRGRQPLLSFLRQTYNVLYLFPSYTKSCFDEHSFFHSREIETENNNSPSRCVQDNGLLSSCSAHRSHPLPYSCALKVPAEPKNPSLSITLLCRLQVLSMFFAVARLRLPLVALAFFLPSSLAREQSLCMFAIFFRYIRR